MSDSTSDDDPKKSSSNLTDETTGGSDIDAGDRLAIGNASKGSDVGLFTNTSVESVIEGNSERLDDCGDATGISGRAEDMSAMDPSNGGTAEDFEIEASAVIGVIAGISGNASIAVIGTLGPMSEGVGCSNDQGGVSPG